MFKNHYTLYLVEKVLTKVLMVLVVIGSLIGAIICFANSLVGIGFLVLGIAAVSLIILYLAVVLLTSLMKDIEELDAKIKELEAKSDSISKKQSSSSETIKNIVVQKEVEKRDNVIKEEQPEPVKPVKAKDSKEIDVDDMVVVVADVTKDGKLIKKGTVGKVENYLYGSLGKRYIVSFKGDENTYKFSKEELELK